MGEKAMFESKARNVLRFWKHLQNQRKEKTYIIDTSCRKKRSWNHFLNIFFLIIHGRFQMRVLVWEGKRCSRESCFPRKHRVQIKVMWLPRHCTSGEKNECGVGGPGNANSWGQRGRVFPGDTSGCVTSQSLSKHWGRGREVDPVGLNLPHILSLQLINPLIFHGILHWFTEWFGLERP